MEDHATDNEDAKARRSAGEAMSDTIGATSRVVTEQGNSLFENIGGAIYALFINVVVEAGRVAFILIFKLYLWTILPLLSVYGALLYLSSINLFWLGAAAILAFIITWEVIKTVIRELTGKFSEIPDDHSALPRPRGLRRIGYSLARIFRQLTNIIRGAVRKNALIGFIVRTLGLAIILLYEFPNLGVDIRFAANPVHDALVAFNERWIVVPLQGSWNLIEPLITTSLEWMGIEYPFVELEPFGSEAN